MTEAEIIKALECCSSSPAKCGDCPCLQLCDCLAVEKDALDLINRQKAEIERRKNNLFCKVVIDEEAMRNIVKEKAAEFELDIASIKTEAIKELMFNLDEEISTYSSAGHDLNVYAWLKNYAKVKVGE